MQLRCLLVFFLLFIQLFAVNRQLIGQEKEISIMLVPFDRFAFQSDYDIQKIASVNDLSDVDSVYIAVMDRFVEELSKPTGNYSFFELTANERQKLLRRIPPLYKEEPVSHFGFDLSSVINNGDLPSLLENFSADYILFISRFGIKKKMLLTPENFEGSKFIAWSSYMISYELYDKNGELIALDNQFDVKSILPNEKTYTTSGLLLESFDNRFVALQQDITSKINRYKGEPIYK